MVTKGTNGIGADTGNRREPAHRRAKARSDVEASNNQGDRVMGKVLAMIGMIGLLVVGLAACHAGFSIGDNDRGPTHVASDAWESAVAQASIGATSAATWTAD